jgi:hypothetical protein
MIGRKGQGAMEYLMTYGWAILVVMIVGIVMWQLGIFGGGSTPMTATGFSKIKPQLAGSGVDRNGVPKLIFTNGVGTNIVIKSGKLGPIAGATSSCALTTASFKPYSIPAGENTKVSKIACLKAGPAAAVYSLPVSIVYEVSVGGITNVHTESGSIRGGFE